MSPTDLFPASEFDDWAETYDTSIAIDQFPFYGYREVLEKALTLAEVSPGLSVLDLGTGTGNLAARFAHIGCELWCTDFSAPMLAKARQKLPEAHFLLHDLRMDLPSGWNRPFDRMVSAYVFHHFELDEKVHILQKLAACLTPGGRIVIADIAFPDQTALEKMKEQVGAEWEDEFYWIGDRAIPAVEKAGFKVEYLQVSVCAGIFTLQG
jgi:putative AdoMet-dependent methyltransferase